MDSKQLTAREALELKGSLIYFYGYILITILAVIFQLLAGQNYKTIVISTLMNGIVLSLSFVIYLRKKSGKSAEAFVWSAALCSMLSTLIARYVYALNFDWTYAAESYQLPFSAYVKHTLPRK
ncbi:MAG: hypothetical protein CVV49_05435 [Spirochaetae bacterium HGW-Spirochaetae-5]|nr:MAG: hypothetical protein CVV49_05435 [Spirochaetae bacterium HGW-Spirochaetae-5]